MKTRSVVLKAENEFKVMNEIKDLFDSATMNLWIAAEKLIDVRNRKGYRALGYETLDDYCEDGVGRSYKTVHQLLKAYEVIVVKFKHDPKELPEPSKAYLVSELMEKDPNNESEWLSKATALTIRQLRDEKAEFKTGVNEFECEHPEEIIYSFCVKCKRRRRLFPNELKKVGIINNKFKHNYAK